MKSVYIAFFFLLITFSVFAQPETDSAFYRELAFMQHLVRLNKSGEAIQYGKQLLNNPDISQSDRDTLYYSIGWLYYTQKELENSSAYLLQVSRNSTAYIKSVFFSAYNNIYLGRYHVADSLLDLIYSDDALLNSLKSFERSGSSLLQRDFDNFRSKSLLYNRQYFALEKQADQLDHYYQGLINYKPKSPGLAALMSGIIPGSGKIYAGKTGEGIAAFLVVTALSLITYENYRKDGLTNYKTMFFGGITGIYYIGNILGSAATARVKNKEFNYEMDQRILFDIHIPLRTIFN